MNIPIDETSERQVFHLNSVNLLKYFLGVDEHIDDLVICKSSIYEIETTDREIYEALASLEPYDNFQINKLVKLMENVRIIPTNKRRVLTFERKEEIRKKALSGVKLK